jgi:hemoglobin-like flavoprotein
MTERQLLLLRNSWSFMMIRSQEAATLFYLRLFETVPLMNKTAASDLREQSARFIHMVTLILTKFQHPEDILSEIRRVPEWRRRYRLREQDYPVVAECLVHTLKKSLGNVFTADTESAWRAAFQLIETTHVHDQEAVAQ